MVDFPKPDDVLPPTMEEAAAGLNLTDPVSPREVSSQRSIDAAASANQQREYVRAEEVGRFTVDDYNQAIGRGMLTRQLVDQAFRDPTFTKDPAFTFDRKMERYKEMQKEVPEHMWGHFNDIGSDAEWDFKLARAKQHIADQQLLAEAGWGPTLANFAAQMLDPASLAIGFGTGTLAIKAAQLARFGRTGQRVANAAGGGLGGVATAEAMDRAGLPVTTGEYMFMAGLGMALGGAFGPLGTNPATRREAAVLVKVGEEAQEAVEKAATQAPAKPATQADIQRAEEAVKVEPQATPAPATPESVPDYLWRRVEENDVKPDDAYSELLTAAKLAREGGALQSREQFEAFTDAFEKIKGGPRRKGNIAKLVNKTIETGEVPQPKAPKVKTPAAAEPAPTAGDQAEELVQSVAPEVVPQGAVKEIVDSIVPAPQEAATAAKQADPTTQPGLITAKPDEALAAIQAADDDEFGTALVPLSREQRKDKTLREQYVTMDGDEFHIRSASEDGTGPFAIHKNGSSKPMVKGIETLAEARSKVPGISGPKSGGSAALAEAAPLRGNLGEETGSYTFRGYTYRLDDENYYTVLKGDKVVGEMEIGAQEGRPYVSWLKINEDEKGGMGAYGAYLVAQRIHGVGGIPDGALSKDSFPIFSKLLPWVREWYREDPSKPGKGWMISPKRLLMEYESIRGNPKKVDLAKQFEKQIASLPAEALEHDNLARMFYALRDPMAGAISRPQARELIERTLDRILPKAVRKEIADEIDVKSKGPLDGLYRDRVVHVAMNADNPLAIAYHETTHALRQLGMISNREWGKLRKWARDTGAHEKYRLRERYASENLSKDALDEEAVAHALGDKLAGRALGHRDADTILDKVVDVLRAIRDALGISGFRTLRDIFDDIDSGVIASRPMAGDLNDAAFSAARRAAIGDNGGPPLEVVSEQWLKDMAWQSISDENVPYSGGFWRFDRAGMIGHSENAPGRLIGRSLINDSVGTADHSVNGRPADLDQIRMYNEWTGDYWRTANPAFQEWADDLRLSPFDRQRRGHEFFEEVSRYIRDRDRGASTDGYHAAVVRLGNKQAAIQAQILEHYKNPLKREGLVGRPFSGSEMTPEDAHYLWRKFVPAKVRESIARFGEGVRDDGSMRGVTLMVANAIRSAQPEIPDEVLRKLAPAYVRNIYARSVGLGDEWSIAIGQKDQHRFRALLRDEAHLTDAEIDPIIDRVFAKPNTDDAGRVANLKRRVLLDENYVEYGVRDENGNVIGDLAFTDLLENNSANLMMHYARRASGAIALARVRVRLPDGQLLVNGISSDQEFAEILANVQRWGVDRGQHESAREMVERLQFAYDRIKGVPNPLQHTKTAKWLRLLRAFQVTRLMGQSGVAQLGESGQALGSLGAKAGLAHTPSYKRIIDDAGDSRLRNRLHDELEAMGIGAERLHGFHFHNLDEVNEMPFGVTHDGLDKAIEYGRMAERATFEVSGMSPLQVMQERHYAAGMVQNFAYMADKLKQGKSLSRGDRRRLAQLGIDDAMMTRIVAQFRHVDRVEKAMFDGVVTRLNGHLWTDLEAKAAFEDAILRATRKHIQAGDIGNSPAFMSTPIWQTIFQFRGHPLTAWANQLQYNIHMADARAIQAFLWGVVWTAAVRGAQLQALAAARSDKDEYLEKHLTPWELGKAGFERSGWASIVPMGIDTALTLAGQPGAFNSRSSGQSSSLLFGNPTVSTLDSIGKGLGGAINSFVDDRPMSQAEVRSGVGLLPWANTLPFATGLSYLVQDLPERAPRNTERPW
jgi:hypothetical protein